MVMLVLLFKKEITPNDVIRSVNMFFLSNSQNDRSSEQVTLKDENNYFHICYQ
jgi:hypothetical protein